MNVPASIHRNAVSIQANAQTRNALPVVPMQPVPVLDPRSFSVV